MKRQSPSRKPIVEAPLNWTTSAQFSCTTVRDEVRLGVVCQLLYDQWQVLAIETPLSSQSPDDVFKHHTHKVVGNYPTPTKALEAAESFARAWLRRFKATSSKACDCKEMGTD